MGLHAFMVKGTKGAGGEGEWHCRLAVKARLVLRDGTEVPVSALVDTGSEVNLVNKGLIENGHTKACGPEVRFCAANRQSMGKDHRQVSCDIVMVRPSQDKGVRTEVVCPD